MDEFIFTKQELLFFIGYLFILALTWDFFIKKNRKIKKPFTKDAKYTFIQYIFFILPMVSFVSKIIIEEMPIRLMIIYLSILNIIVYYLILLIHFFKKK